MRREAKDGLVVGLVALLAVLSLAMWLRGPGAGWRDEPTHAVVGLDAKAPFAVVDCGSRMFDDRPALAVMLSQPVDAKQKLSEALRVTDLGAVTAGKGAASAPSSGHGGSPGAARPGATSPAPQGAGSSAEPGTGLVSGDWTVGENPRIVYFPYVQPQRRLRIDVGTALRSVDGATLPAAANCELASEAMPASFGFASRGTVLPAGQNGGLPIVTVNVPEVDVQFLRVETTALPRFLERVAASRAPSLRPGDEDAGAEEDSEDEGDYGSQRQLSLQGAVSGWALDELKDAARSVYLGRYRTTDATDRRQVSFLDVESTPELQSPGVYVAVMSQPGRFRYEQQTSYFYVTDIGLHARRYAEGLQVFATSLKSGEALAGIEVELLDRDARSLAHARTDAEGRAAFATVREGATVLLARRGAAEISLIALREPALDLSEFDVGGLPSGAVELFAWAGRDLYRPGERFELSVLSRDPDGRTVDALPLQATLKRPDGRTLRQASWAADAARPGYFQRTVELPADAPTGRWTLELRRDPAAKHADTVWAFQVEEFLPERLKLALRHDAPVLAPEEPFEVAVQGDYLYGSPAAGNRLVASVASERQRYALPQAWPGFLFGDFADDARKGREEVPETELDERGAAVVELPARPGPAARRDEPLNSPMLVRGSFSLLESGGRPVVRSIDRVLWPAPQLIAVRPLFDRDVAAEDAPAAFELVRVDAEGRLAPLPAGQTATLRLVREEREYHWRYDDQKGWHAGYVEQDRVVETRPLALAGRERVTLTLGYGRYRLEVDDPQTGLALRYRFYAGWGAQDAESIGNRPDRVQLQVSGLPIAEGTPLRVKILPPHDGQALVTVEGDRLLWSRRVAIETAGTEIEIPYDPAWARHDLYLGVTAFRPGSAGRLVTPSRAVGLVHLPLQRAARRLAVAIEAPAKVEPERRTTVTLRVRAPAAGVAPGQGAASAVAAGEVPRSAQVTLSAVDVGILEITRYAPPDPAAFFFGKHRYGAELSDLYGRLIEKMEGGTARLRYGGDSAARDTRSLPKKVKLVDLFSGLVALDANGEARIPLDLPDFNGRLRLMAVAFDAERYGSAQAEMTVAAPIVAELAMPRFIAPGDRATVALDVTNLSGVPQDVELRLEGEAPVAVGGAVQRLILGNQQRQTLRFPVEAVDAYGLGRLKLAVDAWPAGGNVSTKAPIAVRREAWLQVQPPVPLRRELRRVRVEPGARVALEVPALAGWYPASATASLALGDRPPLNLKLLATGLIEYPYGCLEQTTSAAYPWLAFDEPTARALGLTSRSPQERRAAIDTAVSRIASLQRANGSVSLWAGGAIEGWLAAYVGGFLLDAREAGFAVPDTLVTRSREWLQQQLLQAPNRFPEWSPALRAALVAGAAASASASASATTPESASAPAPSTEAAPPTGGAASTAQPRIDHRDLDLLRDGHQRFAELAHIGYVLARERQAPLASLRVLHDRYRDRARSPLPLVHLAIALRLMGDAPRAAAALEDAMRRPYGIGAAFPADRLPGGWIGDEWLGDYGSAPRDLALAYGLLLRHEIDHPRREQLLFEATDRLAGRRYLSTQERYALFEAGRRAGLAADAPGAAPWQARLEAAGRDAALDRSQPVQTIAAEAWREGRAPVLVNTGTRPLFAELDVAGYPLRAPAPRRDEIDLERRWFDAGGKPWPAAREPKVGESLIVELAARARYRLENALVVDRIPAGFEIENLNLSQGESASALVVEGRNVAEAMDDPRIAHREFRDDRYVAAARLDRDWLRLYYLVRVVSPGRFVVPAPFAEDMYRPELYGVGVAPAAVVNIVDPRAMP